MDRQVCLSVHQVFVCPNIKSVCAPIQYLSIHPSSLSVRPSSVFFCPSIHSACPSNHCLYVHQVAVCPSIKSQSVLSVHKITASRASCHSLSIIKSLSVRPSSVCLSVHQVCL